MKARDRLWLAAGAAILAYLLLIPPVVGIADNGDFNRVMSRFGLSALAPGDVPRYFAYVHRTYVFDTKEPVTFERVWNGYQSSEVWLAAAAVGLNALFSKDGLFDIRVMGLLHALLLLAAWFVFLKHLPERPGWLRWALPLVGLLIFFDSGYVSNFNSFYSEGGALSFLLLTAALCLHIERTGKAGWGAWAAFSLAGLGLVTSKPQYVLLAPLVVSAGALLLWHCRDGRPIAWTKLAALVLLIPASLFCFYRYPEQYRKAHLFNVIFLDMLPHSPDALADLKELGLDSSMVRYLGADVWSQVNVESAEMERELYSRVSTVDIAGFYLRHPGRFYDLLDEGARQGFEIGSLSFGQLEAAPGIGPRQHTQAFHLWGALKRPCGAWGGVLLSLLAVAVLSLAAWGWRSAGLKTPALLGVAILLAAGIQMGSAIFGEGRVGLARHLLLFNTTVDLALIWTLAMAVRLSGKPGKPRIL